MPSQNYGMLSETRATRPIYHVYSVYLVFAIVEYNEASCRGKSAPMSALAKLGTLIWCFMRPHSHCSALNHSICLCLLVQVASSGSLKFHTPLKCPYKHSLTSPLLSSKISHDMWESASKLGTSIWCFIRLLMRTIPLYLRDCKVCWRAQRCVTCT